MIKLYIATKRDVGNQCKKWASNNLPEDIFLTENIDDSDILISIIYDKIFNEKFLKNRKCFNFHLGKLPEYGGSNIPVWALLNNESEFGITLHLIDQGVDTGDIFDIEKFKIEKFDTAYSINQKSQKVILKMFKKWFLRLIKDDFTAVKQDKSKSKMYYKKQLDEVKDISVLARAMYFPGKESLFFINSKGKKIHVTYY